MAEKTTEQVGIREIIERAQAAQQAHAQKHDVQLALISLVASPRKWEAS